MINWHNLLINKGRTAATAEVSIKKHTHKKKSILHLLFSKSGCARRAHMKAKIKRIKSRQQQIQKILQELEARISESDGNQKNNSYADKNNTNTR